MFLEIHSTFVPMRVKTMGIYLEENLYLNIIMILRIQY